MTVEPGREAWACPGCGFVVGFVDENSNLVIWHYPKGFITLRCGIFTCSCGHVEQWRETTVSNVLDKDATPVV